MIESHDIDYENTPQARGMDDEMDRREFLQKIGIVAGSVLISAGIGGVGGYFIGRGKACPAPAALGPVATGTTAPSATVENTSAPSDTLAPAVPKNPAASATASETLAPCPTTAESDEQLNADAVVEWFKEHNLVPSVKDGNLVLTKDGKDYKFRLETDTDCKTGGVKPLIILVFEDNICATPTPTGTPSATEKGQPSAQPSATGTPRPDFTPTGTASRVPTGTPTVTPDNTATATLTPSGTVEVTFSLTPSATATRESTDTLTPTNTATKKYVSPTPVPTNTDAPIPTATQGIAPTLPGTATDIP